MARGDSTSASAGRERRDQGELPFAAVTQCPAQTPVTPQSLDATERTLKCQKDLATRAAICTAPSRASASLGNDPLGALLVPNVAEPAFGGAGGLARLLVRIQDV